MINLDEFRASLTSPLTMAQYLAGFLVNKTDKEKYDIVLSLQGEIMTLLLESFDKTRNDQGSQEAIDAQVLCCACITGLALLRSEQAHLTLDLMEEISKKVISEDWASTMDGNKAYRDTLN